MLCHIAIDLSSNTVPLTSWLCAFQIKKNYVGLKKIISKIYFLMHFLREKFLMLQGIMSRVHETAMVLFLLAVVVFGIAWVASALINEDHYSKQQLFGIFLFPFFLCFLFVSLLFIGVKPPGPQYFISCIDEFKAQRETTASR